MHRLELKWIRSRDERGIHFWDMIVSGKSLYEVVLENRLDCVSVLGSHGSQLDRTAQEQLLLEAPGDFPGGRIALYVCPLCADFGCGAVSAKIWRDSSNIVWSNLAFGTDDEDLSPIEPAGPLSFDIDQYRHAILNRAA